jgi:S-formylglutathione hydrolase FrmB
MSGATYFAHERSERHTDDDVFYLAQALPRERNDLFVLAEGLARTGSPSASQGSPPAAQAPAIRQSCGREDSLLGTNMAFHRHLEGLALAHEWVEHPGGHDQPTFDAQLPLALAWALVRLGCP